ncbi:hypothetical protein BROUX41_001650 [Berkeleyomyces rouxiae]|uniref:uncharacterized protein n=1 Tax=Berkeleyomyces rouxiae TaxID=2035830 RepID=UPI003B776043
MPGVVSSSADAIAALSVSHQNNLPFPDGPLPLSIAGDSARPAGSLSIRAASGTALCAAHAQPQPQHPSLLVKSHPPPASLQARIVTTTSSNSALAPTDSVPHTTSSAPQSQAPAHLHGASPQRGFRIGVPGLLLSSAAAPPSEKRKRSGPVLRDAPKSPIRVNVKTSPIMQPSNAQIEEASPLQSSPILAATFSPAVTITTHHTDTEANAPNIITSDAATHGNLHNRSLEDPHNIIAQSFSPSPFTLNLEANARSRASLPYFLPPSTPSPDIMASAQQPPSPSLRNNPEILYSTSSQLPYESSTTTGLSASSAPNANPKISAQSSATSTSSISISAPNENDGAEGSVQGSSASSQEVEVEPVAGFAYHHNPYPTRVASVPIGHDGRGQSTPNLLNEGNDIRRHLSPNIQHPQQRSSIGRPLSAYSIYSEFPQRGRSPGMGGTNSPHLRNPSTSGRRSPDTRPQSYIDMLNTSYPQPAPAPMSFDNSHLKHSVGNNASLLGSEKTLEMYRSNIKKTNDLSVQYSFAVFLISSAQEQALAQAEAGGEATPAEKSAPHELIREAKSILQRLASSGYPFAQYYLADGYASGLFSKGKEDYSQAFPLFAMAAKHGHAESAYRAALCYEYGWGTRKDPVKALNFLRVGATKKHPGAMTRLGVSCLSGDLGERKYKEGIKWLKLAAEMADTIYPAAPYILGCMYEKGDGEDIFQDESYAAELFTQAAELGNADASFRMGDAYEHGKLNCPRNPALSVHFYTDAAEKGNAAAMMGLCAWYMVGAEPVLEKDEEEAYEWAKRAADLGYTKAEYAIGYFTEMGIGCHRDILEANVWYVKAAEKGDERAKVRITTIDAAIRGGKPMEVAPARGSNGKLKKGGAGSKKDGECVVM